MQTREPNRSTRQNPSTQNRDEIPLVVDRGHLEHVKVNRATMTDVQGYGRSADKIILSPELRHQGQ